MEVENRAVEIAEQEVFAPAGSGPIRGERVPECLGGCAEPAVGVGKRRRCQAAGQVEATPEVDERTDHRRVFHLPTVPLLLGERPRSLGVLLPEVDPLAEPIPPVAARLHRLARDEHAVSRGLIAAVEAYDDAVVEESEG